MDDWAQGRAAAIIIHVGKVEGGGEALAPPLKKEEEGAVYAGAFFLWGNVQFLTLTFLLYTLFFLAMSVPRLAFVFFFFFFLVYVPQRRRASYLFPLLRHSIRSELFSFFTTTSIILNTTHSPRRDQSAKQAHQHGERDAAAATHFCSLLFVL